MAHQQQKELKMKHFTIDELTHSDTASRLGISNIPDNRATAFLHRLVASTLDPARLFGILQSLPHTELIWENQGTWIHVAL